MEGFEKTIINCPLSVLRIRKLKMTNLALYVYVYGVKYLHIHKTMTFMVERNEA